MYASSQCRMIMTSLNITPNSKALHSKVSIYRRQLAKTILIQIVHLHVGIPQQISLDIRSLQDSHHQLLPIIWSCYEPFHLAADNSWTLKSCASSSPNSSVHIRSALELGLHISSFFESLWRTNQEANPPMWLMSTLHNNSSWTFNFPFYFSWVNESNKSSSYHTNIQRDFTPWLLQDTPTGSGIIQ